MKRIRLLAVAIATFALLAGCSGNATNNTETTGGQLSGDNISVTNDNDINPTNSIIDEEGDSIEIEEMEDMEEMEEAKQVAELTYIGHASIKIVAKDGTVLLIDPNYEEWDWKSEDPDVVLLTHSHGDHTPNFNLTMSDSCQYITYKEAHTGDTYESYDIGAFHIEAVPAGGNPNHDIKYCVGYIVTVDGVSVYHAGDTSTLESMSELADKNIDYAMFPIDGVYNMDAVEATRVAEMVKAKSNIPIHELNEEGRPAKEDNFTPEGKLVLTYGQTILLAE